MYAFLLLVAYYILRTLREPLLLARGSAELKIYASATAALALLVLVPVYGAAFRRADKNQLVRWVTGFFIATLAALYFAGRSGLDIGFVYYVWVGIFGVTIVAQFWAHAADCFDVPTGRRLFPVIMTGATLGGIAGPSIYRALLGAFDSWQLMLVAMTLLASTLPLVEWTRNSVPAFCSADVAGAQPRTRNALGGFSLVMRDRYVLLLALLVVLLNCVNTMGEYLLTELVIGHAEEQVASDSSLDKGRLIGEFYANFFFAVNVLTVVMQMFLVGRLFRWIGVNGALLVLPLVALIGYGLVACLPIFALLRVVKTFENSGNYSVMNTARQALFLPLPADGKYEGKIATDTFFWRFGDLIPAGIVFVGLHWLDFGTQQFAVVNMALSLAWLGVAVQLAKRTHEPIFGGAAAQVGWPAAGARTFMTVFPAFGVAARASSWLAVALGLVALASSAPAEAARADAAPQRSASLFDDSQPMEMKLAFDAKALRLVCDVNRGVAALAERDQPRGIWWAR